MSSYLIVDGYNIINKWPRLVKAKNLSIESGRDELYRLVQAYCDNKGVDGVIVYDGKSAERTFENGNPAVIYSAKGESADTVIESLIYNISDKSSVRLVTDDRNEANVAMGMGAFVISAKAFESEIKKTIADTAKSIRNNDTSSFTKRLMR